MKEITEALRKFNEERDWEPFHTPENLAKSIAIEAGELLECFQWDSRYDREALSDEIADVMLYCLMLADKAGLDMKKGDAAENQEKRKEVSGGKLPGKKRKVR